ncbi:Serine/threonine-protein phosphatase, related [Eimeria maxima]|uniref:Serine/threonine-protein phosphatase n=1 Tax=Eimeria maxima TaxID=5804 RepID=U6M769_EIMMA|nr:Serine/threonine-protein phosphatase, related [Eimeria maxima]CDJ58913.1 Serine/threonine-protein phosphatase, related [Eimeria maxima]
MPEARFQHSVVFLDSKMVVIGGRTDGDCSKPLSTAVYDTETVEWRLLPSMGRIPCFYSDVEREEQRAKAARQRQQALAITAAAASQQQQQQQPQPLPAAQQQQQMQQRGVAGRTMTSQPAVAAGAAGQVPGIAQQQQQQQQQAYPLQGSLTFSRQSTGLSRQGSRAADIRLASHASVVQEQRGDFSALVRRISIDRLEEEGRKINKSCCSSSGSGPLSPAAARAAALADRIIRLLLRPLLTQQELMALFETDAPFCIPWADVNELCHVVTDIFKEEEMVLNLRAPIKVYGDIHGQYLDLMRLFHLYKMPVEEEEAEQYAAGSRAAKGTLCGDIDCTDYLFLGDYVDRGSHSLETICLLFALKVKYPRQVHLIRGNHEDPGINSLYGFQDECRRRLQEDPIDPNSCWSSFNNAFEFLPVAAIIEDCVLCIHGGIGGSIHSIEQLQALQRPLKVAQVPQTPQEQQVTDLLWSDPTDSDSVLGIAQNEIRDPDGAGKICKFGPDRVVQFLAANNLSLIIRAHECVMDGFERFAGGKLITLFSATNYCNHHQNAGALLYIRRDLTIIPKLIYPANAMSQYITWDERMTELRPPTPPRAPPRMREQQDFDGS